MGTVLELQLVAREPSAARVAADAIYAEVARLERLVSHYDPASDVSRLSATSGRGPQRVDPAVIELLRAALRQGEVSQGAFDVTLGPAIEFWRTADPIVVDRRALADVRGRTGHENVRILPDDRVELLAEGMELDFGGIAKGWALDRVAPLLAGDEIEAALLSFGQSSMLAVGAPAGGDGWTIALRSPEGGIQGRVTLRDQALSVSSSLMEPPVPGDGEGPGRASIVHPRTLYPVEQPALCAVVAADATSADALSTALLVLDPYSAIKLVEAVRGVEAMIVEARGQAWYSSGWLDAARYVEAERARSGRGGRVR